MNRSPQQPGKPDPSQPAVPVEQQLDELLIQIESAEPGTMDHSLLPRSYREQAKRELAKAKAASAEPTAQAHLQSDEPAAFPSGESTPTKPAKPTPTTEQEDMLASLNAALKELSVPPAAKTQPEIAPQPPVEPAPAAAPALSMEERLQQEIAALMNAKPMPARPTPSRGAEDIAADLSLDQGLDDRGAGGPAAEPGVGEMSPEDWDALQVMEGTYESPQQLAAVPGQVPAAGTTPASDTEDQIALEIESLLNAGPTDKAVNVADQSAIDELDRMLAREIDDDDELAGDFHTVEDLTAGIRVPELEEQSFEDEHAATARDVAAELDEQPEYSAPRPTAAPQNEDEDPFAILDEIAQVAEKNEAEHQRQAAIERSRSLPDWSSWLESGREHLLRFCYLLNWPARRFLSAEWRANLGYIALLNLFFGVGFWIVRFLF